MPVVFCKAGSPDCECNRAEVEPTNLPRVNMGGCLGKTKLVFTAKVESPLLICYNEHIRVGVESKMRHQISQKTAISILVLYPAAISSALDFYKILWHIVLECMKRV
jgi:hypothetical protein